MHKLMLFIDGSWLYQNLLVLRNQAGDASFRIDYGKLPKVLASHLSDGRTPLGTEVVRTYLFASYPDNYDPLDKPLVDATLDFYYMLKMEYHYELELYPIDFKRQRVRREDREGDGMLKLQEKCVDVALATTLVYLSTVPGTFDTAVVVIGDKDFKPALQQVRRIGKRVAIASIRSSCSSELRDLYDKAGVRDYDVLWLEDLVSELALRYEEHLEECEHSEHRGDRMVRTTFRPRKNQTFVCDECKQRIREATRKTEQRPALGEAVAPSEPVATAGKNGARVGRVAFLKRDGRYGFIEGAPNESYYFHANDLDGSMSYDKLEEGMELEFDLKLGVQAPPGKPKPATKVRFPK